jgi:hypothetical protein
MRFNFFAIARQICIAVLFPASLFAQDYRAGYIIKNNTDSVSGFIEYSAEKKSSSVCKFRSSRKHKATAFTPEELRAYGFYGDKRYESMQIPDSTTKGKVFIKVIVRGPINLYQYRKTFLVRKDSLVQLPTPKSKVIDTDNGKRTREDSRYKGLLNFLLSDCKLSADETRYTESSLTNLINNYNRCKGLEPLYKKPKPIFKVNFNLTAGYNSSDMTIDLPDPVALNKSNTVVGGLGVDLSSPRIFDRIFFTIDAWYVKNLYQGYYQKKAGSDIIHTDLQMEFTSIKLPLGFRYNFLKDVNTPYIKGGLLVSFLTNHTYEKIEERETLYGEVITTKSGEEDYLQNLPKGVWFGVGYNQKISKNLQLTIEFRYDKGEGFVGTPIQKFSEVKNYNFLLGIRF